MLLNFVVALLNCTVGSQVHDQLAIRLENKDMLVSSIQMASPIRGYFPGAIGVSILSAKTNRVKEVRPSKTWTTLVDHSVRSLTSIDPYNLRIRIVLKNEQILMDMNGRFIRKKLGNEDFENWKGETRELRASQYVSIFGELEKLKP